VRGGDGATLITDDRAGVRRRVGSLLHRAPGHEELTGVDREADGHQQRQERDRDEDDRLAALALAAAPESAKSLEMHG